MKWLFSVQAKKCWSFCNWNMQVIIKYVEWLNKFILLWSLFLIIRNNRQCVYTIKKKKKKFWLMGLLYYSTTNVSLSTPFNLVKQRLFKLNTNFKPFSRFFCPSILSHIFSTVLSTCVNESYWNMKVFTVSKYAKLWKRDRNIDNRFQQLLKTTNKQVKFST